MAPSAPSHFFANIFNRLDTNLAVYVDAVTGRMIDLLATVTPKLWGVAILMYGYSVWFGTVREPLQEGVARLARIGIVVGLVQVANYHAFIADFLLHAPEQLAATVSGKPVTDGINFLDTLWTEQSALADAFWQKGSNQGINGIGLVLVSLIVYTVALLTTGGSAAILIVAKCGLNVWVAIGPLFVLLAMFESTKQFTNAWLGQTITFGLLPMLTAAVIYLIESLCLTYLGDAKAVGAMADPGINQVFPFLFLCGCAGVFLKQIPSFASGLGGGVAVSTLGAIGAAMKAMTGGAGSMKDLFTGKTLSDMRGARKRRAEHAEWAKNNPSMTARAAGMPMKAYRAMTRSKNKLSKA